MAIDSEKKRKSVTNVGKKTRPAVIVPDSSIDAGDRQVVARSAYLGITAAGAPTTENAIFFGANS